MTLSLCNILRTIITRQKKKQRFTHGTEIKPREAGRERERKKAPKNPRKPLIFDEEIPCWERSWSEFFFLSVHSRMQVNLQLDIHSKRREEQKKNSIKVDGHVDSH